MPINQATHQYSHVLFAWLTVLHVHFSWTALIAYAPPAGQYGLCSI